MLINERDTRRERLMQVANDMDDGGTHGAERKRV